MSLPCEPPALSPACGPPQLELWAHTEAEPMRSSHTDTGWSRGPPIRAGPEIAVEPDDFVEPDFDWGA